MVIVILSDCPPRLRGELSKWMLEINAGVYIGNISARVREQLWQLICSDIKNGHATMVYPILNEQRYAFKVYKSKWTPTNFDGLVLVCKPFLNKLHDYNSKIALSQKVDKINKHKQDEFSYPSDYVIVNIITTGINIQLDNIIEIAALKVEKNKPVQEYHCFIRNIFDIYIKRKEFVSSDVPDDNFKNEKEAYEGFLSFVNDSTLICHNAPFIFGFIRKELRKSSFHGLKNRFIDTLRIAEKTLPIEKFSMIDISNYYGIDTSQAKRALGGCYIMQAIYSKLIENVRD